MSEYWKSNAKKYCEYCKVWIYDNKASIGIHESGKTHKENVKERLNEIKKNVSQKKIEDKKYNDSMAAIEKAAMEAMKNDISSDPSLKKQYGSIETTRVAHADVSESKAKKEVSSSVTGSRAPKSDTKSSSPSVAKTVDIATAKRKLDEPNLPESKIGTWQTVKKPVVEVTKPTSTFVDLQLPKSSSGVLATKALGAIVVPKDSPPTSATSKIEPPEENKPKWAPIGGFTPVEELKPQATVSASSSLKEEQSGSVSDEQVNSTARAATETSPPIKQEQQEVGATDASSSSKKKDKKVVFKKRKNDQIQLRERTDD